jgi:hypothetical protein
MPKFTHDCDKCQFLGTEQGCDLYICASRMIKGLGPSIIARFGNDGPQYASVPWGVIEKAETPGQVPPAIMAGVHIVEEIMVDTLKPRSEEFRPFLFAHGTSKVLGNISAHANHLLREGLTAEGFPYDPAPFLPLRAVALLREGTVTFGLTVGGS